MTIEKILLSYEPKKENLLPLLLKVDAIFGHISPEHNDIIAEYFSMSPAQVYEASSFYDLISIKKKPMVIIQVCSSASCSTKNSFKLIDEIERALKIKAGDTFNPKIKLEEISCLGRCGEGPIMVVNGKVYEHVTKSSVHTILKDLA